MVRRIRHTLQTLRERRQPRVDRGASSDGPIEGVHIYPRKRVGRGFGPHWTNRRANDSEHRDRFSGWSWRS